MTTPDPEQRERLAYVTLVSLFLGLLGLFISREQKERQEFDPHPRDIVLIALATFRAGRVAAYERVTEPFRDPVTATVPDEYDAGENVVAEGTGVHKAIGDLVSCPICVGTWVASGLVYGLRVAQGPTRLVAAIPGGSRRAEMLNAATEALSWTGQAARKQSGS